LPDNDEAGRKHAMKAAERLDDVANSIKIVELPGATKKADRRDWVSAGGGSTDLAVLLNGS
jgi:DNA primase